MEPIPEFLRSVAQSDGSLHGTLADSPFGYVELPSNGLILLDGHWTADQLRAIAAYADSLHLSAK